MVKPCWQLASISVEYPYRLLSSKVSNPILANFVLFYLLPVHRRETWQHPVATISGYVPLDS